MAAWLYGVACRASLKARARRNRRQAREVSVANVPEPEVDMPLPTADLLAVLDEELNLLPEKYRAAVVLCDVVGRSYQEISSLARIPMGTIATVLSRSRLKLRDLLKSRGVFDDEAD